MSKTTIEARDKVKGMTALEILAIVAKAKPDSIPKFFCKFGGQIKTIQIETDDAN
jgi:hypothetical protein